MKLVVVGAGKMAGAILEGAQAQGVLDASETGIYHPHQQRRDALAERFGVAAVNDDGVHHAERVLIGVKPQAFDRVAPVIAKPTGSYISIMAGVTAETIAKRLGSGRVVRAMPNLGARVGAATTALSALPNATEDDRGFAQRLFRAIGTVHELPESQFDAFTGLAGSGPAYAALVAEALADGGVRSGFNRDMAKTLAREVLLATAKLLESSGPADLKDEVASANGTAIAGVRQLERLGMRYALMSAVEEATQRARELSGKDDD